ncbi:MAG TPA: MSHA biogenesis protein MshJ [Burkholderiaceae bacterium]
MKQLWLRLSTRIDGMTLRERVMVFGVGLLLMLTFANYLLLDPLLLRQKRLSAQVAQDRTQTEAINAEISAKLAQSAVDPDAPSRMRMAELRQQVGEKQRMLADMQRGLISPDKIAAVLETILRHNGTLRLVSLKTLPVADLQSVAEEAARAAAPAAQAQAQTQTPSPAAAKPAPAAKSAQSAAIYRHGVEIVVEGSYPAMTAYLATLENMQWQLFWGGARLQTGQYPNATLTLNLYTMSLDPKWLHL